jgi:hypothetical protein
MINFLKNKTLSIFKAEFDGRGWSFHAPATLPLGKSPRYMRIEGCVEHRAILDVQGIEPPVVQFVVKLLYYQSYAGSGSNPLHTHMYTLKYK